MIGHDGAMAAARTSYRPGPWRRVAAPAATCVLALVLTSCTGSAPGPAAPGESGEQVALRVTTADGGARGLSDAERTDLEGALGEVLSRYLVQGFLGDYPRERFVGAFADFTGNAAALAARDIHVLTASRVGDAESVRPRRLDAVLSFLVVDGEAIGATAHVDVALEADVGGGRTRDVTLEGRLMLAGSRGRWTVFGFDVDGGASPGEER